MEPHWPAVFRTTALCCLTLAAVSRSSSFQVSSIYLLSSIPRSRSSCFSLIRSSCSLSVPSLSARLRLYLFANFCARVTSTDLHGRMAYALLVLSLTLTPLTHQIATVVSPKAWPSHPSTPISWSTAAVGTWLRGICALIRPRSAAS